MPLRNGSFLNRTRTTHTSFSMQLLQGQKWLQVKSQTSNLQTVTFISPATVSTEDEMKYKMYCGMTSKYHCYPLNTSFAKQESITTTAKAAVVSLVMWKPSTGTWDEVKRETQFTTWKQDRHHHCSSRRSPFIWVSSSQFCFCLLCQPPLFHLPASD